MDWFIKALKQYADFKGRARRKEYWMFYLFYMIYSIPIMIIDLIIGYQIGSFEISPVSILFSLAMFVPSLAVTVRRLHDVGKSGAMILIGIIPIIGTIYLLVLLATEGESGYNNYGPNPKLAQTAHNTL